MQCNSTYGGYYNYAAATAGTIANASNVDDTTEAQYSICPKGWTLPSQSQIESLGGAYGGSGSTTYVSAFSPVYSGNYYNGSLRNTGSTGVGYWWSSTASSSTGRYCLFYYGGSLGVSGYDRYNGFPVRCVRSS